MSVLFWFVNMDLYLFMFPYKCICCEHTRVHNNDLDFDVFHGYLI